MDKPMAWGGALVWLGAVTWSRWQPPLVELIVGVWWMGALALAGQRWPAARLAWLAGAFLVGAAATASLPGPQVLPESLRIQGVVTAASRHQATVQTEAGALVLGFSDTPPRPRQSLAAWTSPATPAVTLPGAWTGLGVPQPAARRVRRWVLLGATPDTTDDPFALAAHGGLLRALARGDRSGVDEATTDLLRRTGTAHLLAISGLHVGLIAGLGWAAGWWASRPLVWLSSPWPARAVPALLSVWLGWGYSALVGWPVSARRAFGMVALVAVGRLLGRRIETWSLLGAAAAVVVLCDPAQADSLSFLMSFGAVIGILAWARSITRWLPPDAPRLVVGIATSLGASVGATIGTLPLTAWLFQSLSPLTPLANLLAGPLLAGVAVPGALLADRLSGDAGLLALAVADAAVSVGLSILTALDVSPWTPAVGPLGALGLALLLPLRRMPVLAAGVALLSLGLREVPTRLEVTFLAIGQGDSALVEWPDGRRWLIDGGPPSTRLLAYLRRRGIRRLDAVVLSHPHPDHMGGLQPVIEALPVGALWVPRPPELGEESYLSLWRAAWAAGVAIRGPEDALPGAEILHPRHGWQAQRRSGRINEESLTLRIAHGAHSFLFTGDIQEEAEALLASSLGPVDVVKVAHHGSTTSSTADFIAATSPAWAVISCGLGNRFRHPRLSVLGRWHQSAIARTDIDGTVRFASDGVTLSVSAWRAGEGWRALR